jgi:hypothetical protein
MAQFSRRLRCVEAHDAARRQHRCDGPHAELGGFLQRPVHALAARDGLHERDAQGRLRQSRRLGADTHEHPFTRDGKDLAPIFVAAAVEGDDRGPFAQAQHACHVIGRRFRQLEIGVRGERLTHVDAGQSHVATSMPSRAVMTSRSISSGVIT